MALSVRAPQAAAFSSARLLSASSFCPASYPSPIHEWELLDEGRAPILMFQSICCESLASASILYCPSVDPVMHPFSPSFSYHLLYARP